ncbi:MAG: CAP domain-containing protein [Prochlorococcaceae cyanobacterium]
MVVGVFFGANNFWYFDNGSGGSDWEIGSPMTSGLQAHRPRSLGESRTLALSLVNRDRKLNGLSVLIDDPLLAQASQLHAKDMLSRDFYSHINPEGQSPTDRFALIGGLAGVGENIAIVTGSNGIALNHRLVEQYHKGWMYSEGHRENLLEDDYVRFGYGIAVDGLSGLAYAVQSFSRGDF